MALIFSLTKRTLKPILWNEALQICLLSSFIFVTCANVFHPFQWLYDWYVMLLWNGYWLYSIPLTVLVLLLASVSTEDYVKNQQFYPTRISLINQAFSSRNIGVAALYILIGFLIPWTYSSLLSGNYSRFVYPCAYNSEDYCFSEKRLFFIESGMWIGGFYYFHCHFFGTRYLKFPIAQLPKFVLIKGHFIDTIKQSIKWTLIPDVSFIVMYYMKFGSMNSFIVDNLGFEIEENRINTLSGILNLTLLTYFIIFSVTITASIRFMEMFSYIYLTERFYFPLYPLPDKDIITLTEGLKKSDYPIVQHLAFLDLMLLSNHDKSRREAIFNLSSFGGHPHLWNSVKEACADIIVEFIEDLKEKDPVVIQEIHSEVKSPLPLKRNVTDYFEGYAKEPLSPSLQKSSNQAQSVIPNNTLERLKKVRCVVFFLETRKDMKIRHTLRLSQPVKWACESLSFLSCYSLKEDKYGILISDLPDIFILLLQTKVMLETVIRNISMGVKLSKQDIQNIAEAVALKKSVKRSIYRIVTFYKYYLKDLQLPKHVESQLSSYVMYKE